MIQTKLQAELYTFINTQANRISPATIQNPIIAGTPAINFLFKFTNDMSGEVQYYYPKSFKIENRATQFSFLDKTLPKIFLGETNFKLAGYWKYEIYEVYWAKYPSALSDDNTPITSSTILEPIPEHGVVKGLIAIGKMYVAEQGGEQEVQYKEYVAPDKDNYIYHGQ